MTSTSSTTSSTSYHGSSKAPTLYDMKKVEEPKAFRTYTEQLDNNDGTVDGRANIYKSEEKDGKTDFKLIGNEKISDMSHDKLEEQLQYSMTYNPRYEGGERSASFDLINKRQIENADGTFDQLDTDKDGKVNLINADTNKKYTPAEIKALEDKQIADINKQKAEGKISDDQAKAEIADIQNQSDYLTKALALDGKDGADDGVLDLRKLDNATKEQFYHDVKLFTKVEPPKPKKKRNILGDMFGWIPGVGDVMKSIGEFISPVLNPILDGVGKVVKFGLDISPIALLPKSWKKAIYDIAPKVVGFIPGVGLLAAPIASYVSAIGEGASGTEAFEAGAKSAAFSFGGAAIDNATKGFLGNYVNSDTILGNALIQGTSAQFKNMLNNGIYNRPLFTNAGVVGLTSVANTAVDFATPEINKFFSTRTGDGVFHQSDLQRFASGFSTKFAQNVAQGFIQDGRLSPANAFVSSFGGEALDFATPYVSQAFGGKNVRQTGFTADGTRFYSDGSQVFKDGSRLTADGTRILTNGTKIDAYGNITKSQDPRYTFMSAAKSFGTSFASQAAKGLFSGQFDLGYAFKDALGSTIAHQFITPAMLRNGVVGHNYWGNFSTNVVEDMFGKAFTGRVTPADLENSFLGSARGARSWYNKDVYNNQLADYYSAKTQNPDGFIAGPPTRPDPLPQYESWWYPGYRKPKPAAVPFNFFNTQGKLPNDINRQLYFQTHAQ